MNFKTYLTCYSWRNDKGTDYVLSWGLKGVYNSKHKTIYTAFIHDKLFGCAKGIKFETDPLALKQDNYLTKTVSVYVVYDLNGWPGNLTNNF